MICTNRCSARIYKRKGVAADAVSCRIIAASLPHHLDCGLFSARLGGKIPFIPLSFERCTTGRCSMSDTQKTKVVVIGGGPGGYAAAFKAADLGLDVTLIDREPNPGGVCLYRGCIPSKALLHVAKLLSEAEEAENWGIHFQKPRIELDKLREWKESVVKKLTGGLGQLAKTRKITFMQGTAKFLDAYSVEVALADGETKRVQFDNAIIATGSIPTRIPALSIDSPRLLDSTGALELDDIPERLLVIGGGYIGLEMGTVYASLGSRVSVVEMMSGLLPGADRDLVQVLHKRLEGKFEDILLETKVTEIKEQKNGLKVTFEPKNGESEARIFDKVLMSIGRRPNCAGLEIEEAGLQTNKQGFIETDSQCRTRQDHIYAIGDIAGEPMLAHKASHEGLVAAESIAGEKVAFEPHAIPAVVFTDPELAWAGLTEQEAKDQGIEVQVAKFPWGASGRATTFDRNDGLTKLIVDPETERLLGIGIVGFNAGEMIAEGVLAIEMAALVSDLKLSIHPHPTLTETVMEAAELFYGSATHVYRPPRKK